MRIVIAGGSGFLGTALRTQLVRERHEPVLLTRRPRHQGDARWDPATPGGDWMRTVDGADAVINLAGESIGGKRWTTARKEAILSSRLQATHAVRTAIERATRPPAVWINAAAIGVYGSRGDETLTEASTPGSGDFLSSVVRAWEDAARTSAATRVVLLRTGLALDRNGGVLPQMALPFHLFAGGPAGSGRQFLSWIHLEDWVRLATWALTTNAVTGPLNATAPNPVTNREFAQVLGKVLRRPSFIPAPALALRLALGEMSELILGGQKVLPAKALAHGFEFRYPALEPALRAIYAPVR